MSVKLFIYFIHYAYFIQTTNIILIKSILSDIKNSNINYILFYSLSILTPSKVHFGFNHKNCLCIQLLYFCALRAVLWSFFMLW